MLRNKPIESENKGEFFRWVERTVRSTSRQGCSISFQGLCCHLGFHLDRSLRPLFPPPRVFLFFLIFIAPPPSLSLCFHALCQSRSAHLKSGKVISLSQISPETVVRHACLKVFAVEERRGCGISHLPTFLRGSILGRTLRGAPLPSLCLISGPATDFCTSEPSGALKSLRE